MSESVEAPVPAPQSMATPDGAMLAPEGPYNEPATPNQFGASSSSAVAAAANGVVLSETQLGNMALRAKQQRTKAEQDKQLLQVRHEVFLLRI